MFKSVIAALAVSAGTMTIVAAAPAFAATASPAAITRHVTLHHGGDARHGDARRGDARWMRLHHGWGMRHDHMGQPGDEHRSTDHMGRGFGHEHAWRHMHHAHRHVM
jgi:hypothetical protein